jgi:hypothetical protein
MRESRIRYSAMRGKFSTAITSERRPRRMPRGSKRWQNKVARIALRIALLKREMTYAQLGKKIGLSAAMVEFAVRGRTGCGRARRLIELELAERFWTQEDDYRRFEKLRGILGFDPVIGTHAQLEAFARTHRVPGKLSNRTKAELLSMIESHFDSRAATAAQTQTTAETPV